VESVETLRDHFFVVRGIDLFSDDGLAPQAASTPAARPLARSSVLLEVLHLAFVLFGLLSG
jgi:hypothetical protein